MTARTGRLVSRCKWENVVAAQLHSSEVLRCGLVDVDSVLCLRAGTALKLEQQLQNKWSLCWQTRYYDGGTWPEQTLFLSFLSASSPSIHPCQTHLLPHARAESWLLILSTDCPWNSTWWMESLWQNIHELTSRQMQKEPWRGGLWTHLPTWHVGRWVQSPPRLHGSFCIRLDANSWIFCHKLSTHHPETKQQAAHPDPFGSHQDPVACG